MWPPALSALLVDGRPTAEPLGGEVDFLRIALAPTGDDAPLARATVIPAASLDAGSLRGRGWSSWPTSPGCRPPRSAALGRFVADGGGLLIAPGGRTDPADWNDRAGPGGGWLPARLGASKGDPAARKAEAHPAPRTFAGPALAPLGGGESPPLAGADVFAYRRLGPVTPRRSWSPGSTRATPGPSSVPTAGAGSCCWRRASTPRAAPCR